MPGIVVLTFIAMGAFVIAGFAVHVLFPAGLLMAGAVVAWIKFRPSRSRR